MGSGTINFKARVPAGHGSSIADRAFQLDPEPGPSHLPISFTYGSARQWFSDNSPSSLPPHSAEASSRLMLLPWLAAVEGLKALSMFGGHAKASRSVIDDPNAPCFFTQGMRALFMDIRRPS